MERDRACLLDVLGSARAIRSYVEGVSRREFLVDQQLQDSVVRRIEIMGEATGRLSPTFREKHADIPWVRIKGMRNRVIHGYDDIDMDIVWDTVEQDIPRLILQIQHLVPPEEGYWPNRPYRPADRRLAPGRAAQHWRYHRKTQLLDLAEDRRPVRYGGASPDTKAIVDSGTFGDIALVYKVRGRVGARRARRKRRSSLNRARLESLKPRARTSSYLREPPSQ